MNERKMKQKIECFYPLENIPLHSSSMVMHVAEQATADYVLLVLKHTPVTFGATALDRLLLVAEDTGAAMVYSDRYVMEQGVREPHPSLTIRKARCVTISTLAVCG